MAPDPRGLRVAFAVLAAAASCGAGCGDAEPVARPEPSRATASEPALAYVGREVCASCHATEVAAFAGSHHDLAMAVAAEDSLRGDFADAPFAGAGGPVRLFREAGAFRVEARGRDGTPVARDVAWAFGVEPLQQLLLPAAGGRLQAFGVAWDARPASEGGRRWFALYPEAEPGSPLH
jgi:hypothetical protein